MGSVASNRSKTFRFRQCETLLRKTLDEAGIGMLVVGTNGEPIYVNQAFGDMLGRQPDECVGMAMAELVHPDDAAAWREQIEKHLDGEGRECPSRRRYLHKNGDAIAVLGSASVLRRDRTGRPCYLSIFAVPVYQQKPAQTETIENDSRWEFALDSAGQGAWDHDLLRGQVFYSRRWRLMRGLDADAEIDGSHEAWLKRVHPEDQEICRRFAHMQDSGELEAFEYRERHQDGHWMWILARGNTVAWTPDGRPARAIGTDTDITNLKAVEANLAEEKERLRVTLQSIGDSVISTDAEARVTFLNPVAEQMTGWRSADAVGRPVEEVFRIVDGVTGGPSISPVAQCLARNNVFHLTDDVVLLSHSGERRNVRDSAAPVRSPKGDVIGSVLVFQDITDSRALQKELAYSATHDSLTGLPNRVAFERKLNDVADQARRERREHALCFIDLDRFKTVNDNAGHAAGDALLRKIAEAIRKDRRAQDFAARIGGDEFALLLPDCTIASAKITARRMIDSIAGASFTWHGKTYQIGASVGIAAITRDSCDPDELMSHADSACYHAKANGRHRASIHDRRGGEAHQFDKSA